MSATGSSGANVALPPQTEYQPSQREGLATHLTVEAARLALLDRARQQSQLNKFSVPRTRTVHTPHFHPLKYGGQERLCWQKQKMYPSMKIKENYSSLLLPQCYRHPISKKQWHLESERVLCLCVHGSLFRSREDRKALGRQRQQIRDSNIPLETSLRDQRAVYSKRSWGVGGGKLLAWRAHQRGTYAS